MAQEAAKFQYLEGLNQEQKEAVTHKEGPLLIVAGAGTGKTTVITRRLAHLIASGLAQPQEILAVTFTEKAAGEMEERADRLLPLGYLDLWISTFHSFCERILKERGLDIGLPTDFKILDQTAGWLLMRQNLDKFNLNYYRPLGNPTKFIHALLAHFSRCKDEAIYPEDYLQYADKLKAHFDDGVFGSRAVDRQDKLSQQEKEAEQQRISELAHAFHIYQRLLLENNALDFGDLINYCLKLFQSRPAILNQYRNQFKYILVDEFQDTNWAQYELVKILAAPKNNLTVCFDDDQAIYRWRGASVTNVLQFKNDYPQAKEVVLVNNYRSTQDILDLSYKFIQLNNPNRLEYQLNQEQDIVEQAKAKGINISGFKKIDKRLKAQTDKIGIIEHLHFKSLEEEAAGTAKRIIGFMAEDKEARFCDFSVLVRANASANVFCRAFERQGIPYEFLASRGLYTRPVILDTISYLKMLDNYHESAALNRLLNSPFWGIPWEDLARTNQFSRKKGQSTYETLKQANLVLGLSKETIKKIEILLAMIQKHSELSRKKSIGEIFITFLEDSGYLKYLVKQDRERDIDFLVQFFKHIKAFEESRLEPNLHSFIQEINMEVDSGETGALEVEPEKGPDAVKIMTIHSAKGLEFEYVFIPNLVDKRFPTIERGEPIEIPQELVKEILPQGDIHLQEERRLFYVAMTRAKKGVFFTSADDYGGARKKRLSRFLQELGLDKIEQDKPAIEEMEGVGRQESVSVSKISLPPYFSYSQFAAFDKCPLQYKFAHILKIPRIGSPVFSFGKTMHNTLYQFVKTFLDSNNKEQSTLFPTSARSQPKTEEAEESVIRKYWQELLEVYRHNWIDEWYEDKRQKEEYYKLGQEVLKNFLEDFTGQKPRIKLLNGSPALELDFRLKIKDNTIIGKIDRIDELPDGQAEIIDYKTGRGKEKLEKEDKEQLLIYQLAGGQIFGKKPEVLSYYFLNDGKKVSFISTPEERERFQKGILEKIEKIKNSDFKATPGWQCRFCDFKNICEFRKID